MTTSGRPPQVEPEPPATLPRLVATRYVAPLWEGGSLPAIVEADEGVDEGALWVVKFVGAAQGRRALVAELIAGELARAVGLPVPRLALVEVGPELGRTEPNPEIRALLRASVGTNLAMMYLPGALAFDPAARPEIAPALASSIVAFDAYVMNVDRTARNSNLLCWRGDLWLIDHGSSLFWHHAWDGLGPLERPIPEAARPFPHVRDHVLLPWADRLPAAGAAVAAAVTDAVITRVLDLVPDVWLVAAMEPGVAPENPSASRDAYRAYLRARRDAMPAVIKEAVDARAQRF